MSRYVLGIAVAVVLASSAGVVQADTVQLLSNSDCIESGGAWVLTGEAQYQAPGYDRDNVIWFEDSSDHKVCQMTSHPIAAGDQISVTLDAADIDTEISSGLEFEIDLLYDNAGTPQWFAYQELTLTNHVNHGSPFDWQTYIYDFTAVAGQDYIGKSLGVGIIGIHHSGHYVGIDNVYMNVTSVPEPSTLVLAVVAASIMGLLAYAWRKR